MATKEQETYFGWCSRILAEIQGDATRMVDLGFGKKKERRHWMAYIDANCNILRQHLADLILKNDANPSA